MCPAGVVSFHRCAVHASMLWDWSMSVVVATGVALYQSQVARVHAKCQAKLSWMGDP